jgi:hypothetical protein
MARNSDDQYITYDLGAPLSCQAQANTNAAFSSWSGDFTSNLNDNPVSINVTRYGNMTANFIPLPPSIQIPWQSLAPLYGIIATGIISWFIPNIARWVSAMNQGKYLNDSMEAIFYTYDTRFQNKNEYLQSLDNIRRQTAKRFARGRISESQYKILNRPVA